MLPLLGGANSVSVVLWEVGLLSNELNPELSVATDDAMKN
jgi:hypothetical protein